MKIIGITGGIGTGKSTVLNILKEKYNAYIIETDKLAHTLMLPGKTAYKGIVDTFSDDILNEDRTINREKLGNIVFKDKEKLQALNEIVHPAVKAFILEDIKKRKEENQISYYVIEAALLIEDGYKEICDELWYVYVEKGERIRRLLLGRGSDVSKWEKVINSQSDEEFYRKNCDKIIDNGKSVEFTENIINEMLFQG